ncbi:MAG: mechanosensitive ion channel family protein [Bacteroidetes bacterium]|nr:mechanosensitive ion channel family protein [Bacteroidota bacterium]
MTNLFLEGETWLWGACILLAAILIGLLVHKIFYGALLKITARTEGILDDSFVRHSKKPAKLIFPLLGIFLVMPIVHFPPAVAATINHTLGLCVIAAVAWLLIALTKVLSDMMAAKYDVSVKDNLTARRVLTQVHVLRRITIVIVSVVALSIMLMTFPEIRNIGAGLFASAGIAGLIIGMAARPTLSNLIAGVQMALTEPIRLDDVVIVEGEWGWIEEIRTTYVVVRIWDLRRLVVPLSYFIEHPFQNWTRKSADLLGTVFVYTDYTVPVEDVRSELHRILQATKRWDGKAWGLQVTNASEHTMELRALMSASDSGTAWDLRCEVREKLIQFLQERYPGSLPRTRVEVGKSIPDNPLTSTQK